MTKARKKNPHRGSKFEDYLAEEGLLEEVTATAMKRVLAWQIAQAMKKQRLTKSTMAKRMRTSRAALDRLLDEDNTSVTLQTMGRAAAVLGKELSIELDSRATNTKTAKTEKIPEQAQVPKSAHTEPENKNLVESIDNELVHFEGGTWHSDCSHCKNNKAFNLPHSLIDAFNDGEVAIFAGAGISTEGRNVLTNTFFEYACDTLKIDPKNTQFPDAMEKFATRPNGRIELVRQIRERFEYIKSFSDLHNEATGFHEELATIFNLDTIITTNWDLYFEEECAAQPFVLDADIAFWGAARRRVLKIHGSIDNPSTIVATRSDYTSNAEKLRTSLVGSMLKSILSTKTTVFCGYSLRDDDFREVMNFVQESLGAFKRQNYVVTLEKSDEALAEFRGMGLIPITTNATFFLESVKAHMCADDHLIPDAMYVAASELLQRLRGLHVQLYEKFNIIDDPEIIYCASYQDGLMHLLQRTGNMKSSGIYSHLCYNEGKLKAYRDWRGIYLKKRKYEDVAYIDGYMNGLLFLILQKEEPGTEPPLFYLYDNPPIEMSDFSTFQKLLKKIGREKTHHKLARKRAVEIAQLFDPEKTRKLVFDHLCQLG